MNSTLRTMNCACCTSAICAGVCCRAFVGGAFSAGAAL